MSTTRAYRRPVMLALVVALVWSAGCTMDLGSKPDVRALDSMCQGNACVTTGSARRTTGITADSVGYQLGPGAGSLRIPVDGQAGGLSVLVRGKGNFYLSLVGCSSCSPESREATSDYRWVDLYSVEDGGIDGYDAAPYVGAEPPPQYTIELSVEGDGSHIDIADLK